MEIIATRMKVFQGCEAEYKKRHDHIWPELAQLLKTYGIHEYRIFLDTEDLALFAILHVEDAQKLTELSAEPLMKKWWEFMKDIMPSHSDFSPQSLSLKQMFYLP